MLTVITSPFPELLTERLKLRRVTIADAKEIFFLRSDKSVLQFLDKAPAKSIDEAIEFIKLLNEMEDKEESITWAITLNNNPQLIGTICYWRIEKEHYRAEIGYVLHPTYHGKGIMQEAMFPILDYGFKVIKLHSIEANVNPSNISSIKLLARNNFKREGYFKENYYFNGKFYDSAIYSLLTTEK